MLWKHITSLNTTCTTSVEVNGSVLYWQADSDKKNSKKEVIVNSFITCDGYEKHGHYQQKGNLQYLNWLREWEFLVPVGYGHIEKVDDDDEDQEDHDVEDDDVDVPWELLQPVDYPEGAEKLRKVGHYIWGFPLVYQLNNCYNSIVTVSSKE